MDSHECFANVCRKLSLNVLSLFAEHSLKTFELRFLNVLANVLCMFICKHS